MRLQIFSVENDLSAKNMAQATANSLYVGVSKHREDIALSGECRSQLLELQNNYFLIAFKTLTYLLLNKLVFLIFSFSNATPTYPTTCSLPVGVGVLLRRENRVFAFRGRHFGLYATRMKPD